MTRLTALLAAGALLAGGLLAGGLVAGGATITRPAAAPSPRPAIPVTTSRTVTAAGSTGRHWWEGYSVNGNPVGVQVLPATLVGRVGVVACGCEGG